MVLLESCNAAVSEQTYTQALPMVFLVLSVTGKGNKTSKESLHGKCCIKCISYLTSTNFVRIIF